MMVVAVAVGMINLPHKIAVKIKQGNAYKVFITMLDT